MATKLITVPFHGNTLYVVDHNGQPHTPLKPIAEGMGLDWRGQHAKITANTARWGVEIISIPSASGQQDTACLPLPKLPGWLMTIHANKVRPEIRDRIITYQNECDDALWDYWTRGEAHREEPEADTFAAERVLIERHADGSYTSTKLDMGAIVIEMHDLLRMQTLVDLIAEFIPPKMLPGLINAAQRRIGSSQTSRVTLASQ